MLTVDEIKRFIERDASSDRKRFARQGVDYFEGKHDILYKRIFFVDAQGTLREEKMKSNFKIPHPFFRLIVEQQAQYMLSSKERHVKSDIPELNAELDHYFGDIFTAELYKVLLGTPQKASEYMYAYKNEEGRTVFEYADSMGIVEVRESETQDHCDHLIRSYIDRVNDNGEAIKRIEVWDSTQTHFYVQVGDGDIVLDEAKEINPKPHTILKKGEKLYRDDYGMIPFFRLDNNAKRIGDLSIIKPLIDDYDLMNVGLSNNIEDANEVLYVVSGFPGDDLDKLMQNIRVKKLIGVGETGGVDVRTVDIPVEARKAKMEIDKENIYLFGKGVNTDALNNGVATVTVKIKTAYYNLDLKCDGLQHELLRFMRQLVSVVLDEINKRNKTAYQMSDVYFDFSRETIVNEQEKAQIALLEAQEQQTRINTLLSTSMQFGDELTIQQICEVYDLDYEAIKDKLPKPDDGADLYTTVANLPVEDVGGDVIE